VTEKKKKWATYDLKKSSRCSGGQASRAPSTDVFAISSLNSLHHNLLSVHKRPLSLGRKQNSLKTMCLMNHVLHGTPQPLHNDKSILPRLFGLGIVVPLATFNQLAVTIAGPLRRDIGKLCAWGGDGDIREKVLVGRGRARGVDVHEGRHFKDLS
jgi:hypothetical protein